MKRLVRRPHANHEGDVAELRANLNATGFDADPVDIESAYSAWCLSRVRQAWWPIKSMSAAHQVVALLEALTPEPEPPAKVEVPHAPLPPQQDARQPAHEEPAPAKSAPAPERSQGEVPRVRDGGQARGAGRRDVR